MKLDVFKMKITNKIYKREGYSAPLDFSTYMFESLHIKSRQSPHTSLLQKNYYTK